MDRFDPLVAAAAWDQVLAGMRPSMRMLAQYHAALIEAGVPIAVAEFLAIGMANAMGFPVEAPTPPE